MKTFRPVITSHCCLCGSDQNLSGEHKIKASALRKEFGQRSLLIGRRGEGYRLAQSPGSKIFHFAAPVCSECNNARTQPADFAFDQLHAAVIALIGAGIDPVQAFKDPRFAPAGMLHLDIYRYFAKLLCCHLAELGAPCQEPIADFAVGFSDANCISLSIDLDSDFARDQSEYPGLPYAAHGGLIVFGNKTTLLPTAFSSARSFGPARYKFRASLTELGQQQLAAEEPEFVEWCRQETLAQV